MGEVASAAAIMSGLALFLGALLAIAYRYLRVEEDPRVAAVEARLAGSNCGGCGQPGCRAFAEAVVKGDAAPGQCTVTAPAAIAAIAAYLGVDAGSFERRVARLRCAGGKSSVAQVAPYDGMASCRAAALVGTGGRSCAFGCLGLGDCARACTFDAIKMNAEQLPVVEPSKCSACNDCVEVCPLHLFELRPLSERLLVQCASPLQGVDARSRCAVACDACGRCAADQGPGVIEMKDGLPIVRLPTQATSAATVRCPTGAIRWVDGRQFEEQRALGALKGRRDAWVD